jgi:hypothetical protein
LKNIILTILFGFLFAESSAIQDTLKKISSIQGDIVDFTVDNLGFVYVLNSNNQLKKLGINGDSIGVFNNVRQYGKVEMIDATNPLRILLYYRDFGNVVTLDRFLNMRNTINLKKLNFFQVRAISQAYDNGIWIYDEQEARLKHLKEDGGLMGQSSDFRQVMEAAPSPVRIIDQDRLVYLYDPEKGLFVFDYFGTLKNKVALLGWEDFQVVNGKAFGRKAGIIQQYEPGTLSLKEQALPAILTGIVKIKISPRYLYCLGTNVINVYAL